MEAVSDVKQRDADLAGSGLPQTFDEVVDHLDLSRSTWVTDQCWAQKIGIGAEHFGVGLDQEVVAHPRDTYFDY
jgi:hypothetical protein